ncbi:hypothetical protein Hanom_Chr07g00599801 [Helianthus anomalus]
MECEELHGESVESEEVHGDKIQSLKTKGALNTTQFPTQEKHVRQSTQPPFDLNKSIGSFSVGSTHEESVGLSRKRPRRCISSSHELSGGPGGHTGGPGNTRNPFQELIKKSKMTSHVPNPAPFSGEQNNVSAYDDTTEDVTGQREEPGESNQQFGVDSRSVYQVPGHEPVTEEGGMEPGDDQI